MVMEKATEWSADVNLFDHRVWASIIYRIHLGWPWDTGEDEQQVSCDYCGYKNTWQEWAKGRIAECPNCNGDILVALVKEAANG